MFLSGVIFATTAVYLVCSEERIFEQETSVEMAAGLFCDKSMKIINVKKSFETQFVLFVGCSMDKA